ncbi:MAG: nitroreductase family protein [Nocardioidaceae bacterium]
MKSLLSKLRRGGVKARRRLGGWAQSRGPGTRQLYLRLFSDAFRREERAVGRGQTVYYERSALGRDLYNARRNVHMLEKGLTMRPRRSEFALDYIDQTVEVIERALAHGTLVAETAEADWMFAVLGEYFAATASSESERVVRARERFAALRTAVPSLEGVEGPHHPGDSGETLDVKQLARLAQDRRSVRWFLPGSVPREMVEAAVAIGIEGPTACNRQPYRFEIFDDPASVAKVAAVPMGTRGYAGQIPGMIVVIGDYSAFFDERDRHLVYIDSCLASMGLILGLEAQGVGTCCINWPDITERELTMRKLLGLAAHEKVIMLIAYGYADPTGLVPASVKKPLEAARRFREL